MTPGHGAPRPGPVTRLLLRRADPKHLEQLLAEIAELYEHRAAASGPDAARRWIRREHRRLAWRAVVGDRMGPIDPSYAGSTRGGVPALWQDIRHSARGLRRAPLFTAAIVSTVGLGIGGTTLVFSIVDSVLIAPLDYPGSERMVLLRTIDGDNAWSTSMADLHGLVETPPEAFEDIAAYTRRRNRIAVTGDTELLRTKWVTANYFEVLGHTPIEGRHPTGPEGTEGAPRVALVTETFRTRSFSAETDPIGRSILVDGQPFEVVGVVPDRLGPLDVGIEVFPVLEVAAPPRKGPFFFPIIGRLRPGATPEVARSQLRALSERLFPIWQNSFPQPNAHLGFVDLKEILVQNVSRTLMVVLSAVGFLLLIASANAASLLVARGATRTRELAVRSALGASRARVLRLLLAEAGAIAAAASVVAWAVVWIGLDVVRRVGVGRLPRVEELGIRPSTIGFFLAVTAASWVLFGLVAALATARARTAGVAGTQGRSTSGPAANALRRGLVGAQFAIAIPLLVGAALLVRSLDRAQSESFGFDPTGVASMLVTLPQEQYASPEAVRAFWSDVLPRIEALPGVAAAGLADARPPMALDGGNNFLLEDRPLAADEAPPTAPWITADARFFSTLGLRLLEGRFYEAVPQDTMRYAVVDESWVQRFYPGESAVGRRFRSGGCTVDGCPWAEVVGVVENVKTSGLDDTRALGTIYFDFNADTYSSMLLHIRARGDALAAVPGVRALIQERDPAIPVADVMTATDIATESLTGRRYTSTLVGLLAGLALLLTVVGVYGVMAYYVQHHVREIGIRIALGGGPTGALKGVVARGMFVAGAGTVVGLLLTPLLTRPMAGMLYRVSPMDFGVLSAVTILTLSVALAATLIPGRQAATTDPATTLREE